MKLLEAVTNKVAILEVMECDCGYHFGIDSTFLDQVDGSHIQFKDWVCPSCHRKFDLSEFLESEGLKEPIKLNPTSECDDIDHVTILEFEKQVRDLEGVILVVRCPIGTKVKPYPYKRKTSSSTTIKELISTRVQRCVGDAEVTVISGSYTTPIPRHTVGNIRNSYKQIF